MSDQEIAPTEEAPPVEDVAPEAPEAPQEGDTNPEDWRNNFDPDKAQARITKLQSEAKNLRTRAKSAEEKAAGADEKDQAINTLQRELLQERVARKVGLPDALVERLRGDSEEELLADAQQLIGLVSAPKNIRTKPTEVPRGGNDPEEEPAPDVKKLADDILSTSF